jgi:hypothetical protein
MKQTELRPIGGLLPDENFLHRALSALPCANDYALSELFTIPMLLISALNLTAMP